MRGCLNAQSASWAFSGELKENISSKKTNAFKISYSLLSKLLQILIANRPFKEVHSKEFAFQKFDYIHFNPVEAGIVEKGEDYIYSSAKDYYSGKNVGLLKVNFGMNEILSEDAESSVGQKIVSINSGNGMH